MGCPVRESRQVSVPSPISITNTNCLSAAPGNTNRGPRKVISAQVPDHEPPQGYVCYRCGEKGHWIQVCPTNDDPNFEKKPRVKRTTGIPKSFLKTIEKPAALGANDGTVDDTKGPSGIMINADGEYVIAEPDKASWEQFQAKTKNAAAAQKASVMGNKELQDRRLECPIDKRIFIDPMKTPCCEKTYCNDCITNALIESDFTCPGCHTDGVLIDDLIPDDETSKKIKEYLEEKNAAKKEAAKNSPKSPSSVKTESPAKEKSKSPSPNPKSPSSTTIPQQKNASPEKDKASTPAKDDTKTNNKKRSADELLENPKIPKAPKAMQKQQDMKNMMNCMPNGFPAMPFDMSQPFFPGANGMPNMMGMPMMPNFNSMMGGMNMNMPMNMGMNVGMNMGMNPMMNGFGNMGLGMMPGMMGMMNGAASGHGNSSGGMNGNGGAHMNGANGNGNGSGFPNQQKSVFAEPLPNEEDNAYFRKPVNPHRHGRQRRARPSDYREL